MTHAAVTSAGLRALNEDFVWVAPERGIFAVGDGIGGPGRGDLASELVVASLAAGAAIEPALLAANARIRQEIAEHPERKGMGATVAVAVVQGEDLDLYHLGEVRAYLIRGGEVRQLTEDHTLATQLVKTKQLTPEQALGHPARKTLLRYLGKEEAPKIAHQTLELEPGDMLLLCSDGFYSTLGTDSLRDLCGAAELERQLGAALEEAIAHGSQDNASAVALQVASPGPDTPETSLSAVGLSERLRGLLQALLDAPNPADEIEAMQQDLLGLVLGATRAASGALLIEEDGAWRVLCATGAKAEPYAIQLGRAHAQGAPLVDQGRVIVPIRVERGDETAKLGICLEAPADPAQVEHQTAPYRELVSWLLELRRIAALRQEGASQARRLDTLNELGKAVASSLNLDQVLRLLLEHTLSLTDADTGFVILPAEEGLHCRYGLNRQGHPVEGLEISYTFANKVLETRQPLCILDTGADASTQTTSVMALNLQSVMCVPMIVKDELIGLLYVSSNYVTRSFGSQDLDLLVAIAGQTALSVQNALYVAAIQQKEKMDAELRIARDIQMGLLPAELPAIPGWSLAARCLPAMEVGGDLFEVLHAPAGPLGLFIGDVSGKNVSAALYMAVTHMAVRALLGGCTDPVAGLKQVNATIGSDLRDCNYVTAFFLALDPATGRASFACAGHPPALHVRPDGVTPRWAQGVALGLDADLFNGRLARQDLELAPGEAIVLYTDGITEARNAAGEEFGEERLIELVSAGPWADAEALRAAIFAGVEAFVGEAQPFDDMTVLVVMRDASLALGCR